MKTSFAIIALLASVNAVRFIDDESVDLQLGVEAQARVNVRSQISEDMRDFLQND